MQHIQDKFFIRGYAQGEADLKEKLLDEFKSTLICERESWSNVNQENGNNQGWVEALNYVVEQIHAHTKVAGEKAVPNKELAGLLPEVATKKLDQLCMVIYRADGLKHHSGGYSHWECVDMDDNGEDGWRVFEIDVFGGIQNDTQDSGSKWTYYLHEKWMSFPEDDTKSDYKEWVIVGAGDEVLDWSLTNG